MSFIEKARGTRSIQNLEQTLNGAGLWKYHLLFLAFVTLMAWRNTTSARLVATFDPLYLTFITAFFAALFAIGSRLATQGITFSYAVRPLVRTYIILGIATTTAMLTANLAFQSLSPVVHSLYEVSIYPFAVAIVTWFASRDETVNFRRLIPVLLVAMIGIIIFNLDDLRSEALTASLIGFGWATVSVGGWATSIVMIANLLRQDAAILDVIGFRFAVVALIIGGWLLLNGSLVFESLRDVLPLAFFGFFFPFVLSFMGVRKVSVITFAIYTMLTPILTYGWSILLLDEGSLSTTQLLGASFIFAALIVRTWNESRG